MELPNLLNGGIGTGRAQSAGLARRERRQSARPKTAQNGVKGIARRMRANASTDSIGYRNSVTTAIERPNLNGQFMAKKKHAQSMPHIRRALRPNNEHIVDRMIAREKRCMQRTGAGLERPLSSPSNIVLCGLYDDNSSQMLFHGTSGATATAAVLSSPTADAEVDAAAKD